MGGSGRIAMALVLVVGLAGACTRSGGSGGATAAATTTTTTTTITITTTSGGVAPAETTTTAPLPLPPAAAPVDRLVVATPPAGMPEYRRAEFGDGWDYDGRTGCDTRERVLAQESLIPVTIGPTRCHPIAGRWHSLYDGATVTDPTELEIDHLVPLADAWRSGASAWTPARRRAFANELGRPEELIAVTSHTNRSKGDRGPDEWLPPDRDAWCTYATDWVEVKARWHLSITPAEKATLVQVLSGC